jgi:hypothetical protein
MPISIGGVIYYSAAELVSELGITRQTFWRWRREGKVPAGQRFRDGQILFSQFEFQRARDYAHRLEPTHPAAPDQLKLFNSPS